MALSSQRQRFSIFVSPRNEDFLFYEKVDKQRVIEDIPEYGTPHPDYRKYPNHFFAQAIQADEDGQIYHYYYAAEREYQDEYNWEHRTVDYRQQTYDIVERSYVTLRSKYDEDVPALASPMPITEADPFEEEDKYVLTDRQQYRIGEAGRRSTKLGDKELDSMFVIEKRTFTKRVPITVTQYDKATGAHIFRTTRLVHRDEVPEGGDVSIQELVADTDNPFWEVDEETGSHKQVEQVSEEWYFVTDVVNGDANKRRVFIYLTPDKRDYIFYELVDRKDESALPTPDPAYGSPHDEFTDHVFVSAVPNDPTGDFYRYYYAATRQNQDKYNWNHATTDLGGVRYNTVERTYVIPRVDYDDENPVQASSMPVTTADPFTNADKYILLNRRKQELEGELAELDSIFILETRTYIKRTPLTQTSYNDQTGFHTFRTTEIYYKTETPTDGSTSIQNIVDDTANDFWVVDNDLGAHKVVEQLSSEWYAVISVYNNEASEKRVFRYLTPNQSDFIFYELVDRKDETSEPNPLPEYGTPHPEFTQHKFVAAIASDVSGDFYRYYYAKDRFSQDEYNFEHSFIDVGGVRVSVLRRLYVNLRSNYNAEQPAVGSTMAADPAFAGSYLLAERTQRNIDDETLSSLYISEERVYIKVPEASSQTKNYQLQEGGLSLTRTYIVKRSLLAQFAKPSVGTPDNTFVDYSFATRRIAQETPPELDSIYGVVQDTYAKKDWVFREDVRYEIGYKVIQRTTLQNDSSGQGTYATSFDERGWQRQQTEFELTGFEYTSQNENRPYGRIATVTSAALTPYSGQLNSRSRIVFDDGVTQVYQNDVEEFTVKEGRAGVEKRNQAFVSVSVNKFYRVSGDVTTTSGSSRVIYDDGITKVYEVSEETATGRYGDAGTTVETSRYAKLTTSSVYSATGDISGINGRSRVVYNDGTLIIYQVDNITSVGRYRSSGSSVDKRQFVNIQTTRSYSSSGSVSGDRGRSRIVYDDGDTVVFEVETESRTIGDTGGQWNTNDKRQFVNISTSGNYSTSGAVSGDRSTSRVVYNDGTVIVYSVENETRTIGNINGQWNTNDKQQFVNISTSGNYSTSGAVSGSRGKSRVVYNDGTVIVYSVENETRTIGDISGSWVTNEKRQFVNITTNSNYDTSGSVSGSRGKSRIVYNDGTVKVFAVDNESRTVGDLGATSQIKEVRPYVEIFTNIYYSLVSSVSTPTGSSRIAYDDGEIVVYEIREETPTAKNGDAGETFESRLYGDVKTTSTYAPSGELGGDIGNSRVVYTNGSVVVYQKNIESFDYKQIEDTYTIRRTEWGRIKTLRYYQTSSGARNDARIWRERIVYRNKDTEVYEIEEDEPIFNDPPIVKTKRNTEWGYIETDIYFKEDAPDSPNDSTRNYRVSVAYRDDITSIYRYEEDSPYLDPAVEGQEQLVRTSVNDYREITVKEVYSKTEEKKGNIPSFGTPQQAYELLRQDVVYRDRTDVIYRVEREYAEPIATPSKPIKYITTTDFSWPRVLDGVIEKVFIPKTGPDIIRLYPRWKRRAYRGTCKAMIEESWTQFAPTVTAADENEPNAFDLDMIADDITLDWPIFEFRSGPCLHPLITFKWFTGLNDPDNTRWKDGETYTADFVATNYTDWPTSITVKKEVTKGEGGWILRKIIVYPPTELVEADERSPLTYQNGSPD